MERRGDDRGLVNRAKQQPVRRLPDRVTHAAGDEAAEAGFWAAVAGGDAGHLARELDVDGRVLGPVLPGDHAPVMIIKPKAEHYKAWSITAEYHAGSRVLYQGLPYQAKWGNQGVSPQTEMSDPA